jgi:type I pantothenate kinase
VRTNVQIGNKATAIWERTNLANLEENILPTRPRATLILTKGADHLIETVALRRL